MNTKEIIARLLALAEHGNPAVLSMLPDAKWRQACREAVVMLEQQEDQEIADREFQEYMRNN